MDLIDTVYADVKPAPYRQLWPRRSEEDAARVRKLRDALESLPARLHHLGGTQDHPKYGPMLRELRILEEEQGARLRNAGIARQTIVEMVHPVTGKPRAATLRGWDERDAALKFWRRAYCA